MSPNVRFGDRWWLRLPESLTKRQLRVAFALALYADFESGDNAWPSAATLAQHMGVPLRTVERALAKLRALGLIEAVGHHVPTVAGVSRRGQQTVRYRLTPPSRENGGGLPPSREFDGGTTAILGTDHRQNGSTPRSRENGGQPSLDPHLDRKGRLNNYNYDDAVIG